MGKAINKFIQHHRSWLVSAAIAAMIGVWLLSGQLGADDNTTTASLTPVTEAATRSSVRVRTQMAEEVQRTIVVNGKTAPARIVQLSAETDGRVEATGAERGTNVGRGTTIVRLDERDRSARLAQAQAMVKGHRPP